MSRKLRIIVIGFTFFLSLCTSHKASAQLDVFAGIDVNYRRIYFNERVYDLLIDVAPGIKWQFGNGWQLTASGYVPVINHYGEWYSKPRVNIASVSREFSLGEQHFKVSGGFFSRNRYGLDVKWMWPVCDWFALEGQAGLTGHWEMVNAPGFSTMGRISGLLKARFFISGSKTEFRVSGGRFIYADYGTVTECFWHMRWCSIGAFVQYGNKSGAAGGAKLAVMLPWQGKSGKKFHIRPASSFNMSYDVNADMYALRSYATDPEENERTGHFKDVRWGITQ